MASQMIINQKTRIKDIHGKGHYLATRGKRSHHGLDIVVRPGESIYAPFDGVIIREARPYPKDPSYTGILLKGTGSWEGYEMKIFYMNGLFSGAVREGEKIGTAQDVSLKYPGITIHIHVEVKVAGIEINPLEVWKMSF